VGAHDNDDRARFQCDYEHPAYPGTYTEEFAREHDSITPTPPATEVKSDGAEYVVRLLSMKPMQSAVDRLLTLDEQKWKKYGGGWALTPGSAPTNSAGASLQPGDEITISVVLKKPGPGCEFSGLCFPRINVPGSGVSHLAPCTAVERRPVFQLGY